MSICEDVRRALTETAARRKHASNPCEHVAGRQIDLDRAVAADGVRRLGVGRSTRHDQIRYATGTDWTASTPRLHCAAAYTAVIGSIKSNPMEFVSITYVSRIARKLTRV